jgi:hypothetical protein
VKSCSCGISTGSRLGNFGELVAGTDNPLARGVVDDSRVLVLELSPLPDLDFTTATDDTHTHARQKVVGGVAVEVDTAVEDGCGVLANGRGDKSLATGVFLDEGGDIVDNTGDGDKSLSALGISNKVVPRDNGELLERNTPVEGGALGIELLLLLLEAALLDFVGTEGVQVVGLANKTHEVDENLGRVVLPPLDGVAVIAGEFVVEVVVSLSERDEGGDKVVARAVAVVEWLVAEPVGQAVDAEGGLLDEENAQNTGIDLGRVSIDRSVT